MCFPGFPQAPWSLGKGASCPGQPEWTRPVRTGLVGPGRRSTRAIRGSGSPGEARPAPEPGREPAPAGRSGRGELHPGLCLSCSVYSANRLRTRKQRARSRAQLTAWHWAAPAGHTALHAEAAPGDTRGQKTLPPGACR